MFKGYKTYIVAFVGVVGALAGWATGDMTLSAAIQLAITAILGATIRNAIPQPPAPGS